MVTIVIKKGFSGQTIHPTEVEFNSNHQPHFWNQWTQCILLTQKLTGETFLDIFLLENREQTTTTTHLFSKLTPGSRSHFILDRFMFILREQNKIAFVCSSNREKYKSCLRQEFSRIFAICRIQHLLIYKRYEKWNLFHIFRKFQGLYIFHLVPSNFVKDSQLFLKRKKMLYLRVDHASDHRLYLS